MENSQKYVEARKMIYDCIHKDLIGPKNGANEVLEGENPVLYYSAGILFPQNSLNEQEDSGEDNVKNARTGKPDDGEEDLPVGLENEFYPSAMGISFYLKSNSPGIKIVVNFGLYKKVAEKKDEKSITVYKREQFDNTNNPILAKPDSTKIVLIEGLAVLRIKWRKRSNNLYLITITLINVAETAEDEAPDPENCLFQCTLDSYPDKNTIFTPFENFGYYSPDEEKTILEMLFRKHKPYAVGHGVSADWKIDKSNSHIFSSTYPLAEVLPIDYEIQYFLDEQQAKKSLSIKFLSEIDKDKTKVIKSLRAFVENYHEWILNLKKDNADINETLATMVEKQINNCNESYERMTDGINLLENNKEVREAFAASNFAMLMQLTHNYEIRKLIKPGPLALKQINYEDSETNINWRPFQLGFFLLTLPAIVDGTQRDILDLIWFPAGGGKTEAYLALSAFTILYLRIKEGEKASGTNVLTRYTLRALTTQQFQRSATLICALEKIRSQNNKKFGTEKIRLGLFVGSSSTPNTVSRNYRDDDTCAKEIFQRIETPGNYKNPFPVQNCPWCNNEIIPRKSVSPEEWGIKITDEIFEFFCPNKDCDFHDLIPINIVDEMIYKDPPSMLVGTIDKFARLVWEPRMFSIFGDENKLPPSLIIQDELHLITGPLGSIMGVYETVIDEICTDKNGIKPKIIAATATTRNSKEQVKGLFNREIRLFPPPGLNADDSFFSKTKNAPGRLYCGILNPGKSGLTSTVRLFANLLQSVYELKIEPEIKDNYATLVAYYNSLRELGKNLTLAVDDIPDRIRVIANDREKTRNYEHEEFSSKINSEDLPAIIERLKIKSTGNDKDYIDFLLATNMISVGIDIDRLGLMAVNGQPKTAAEYIQATSRIGRKHPGLVTVLFSPTRIRDRSHYERFKAFHSVFYKEVEPSGVTPFAKPVIDRTIHALLVILARRYSELRQNESAGCFNKEHPSVEEIRKILTKRIMAIEPEALENAVAELNKFANEYWNNMASQYGGSLRYKRPKYGNQFHQILKNFPSQAKEGRETLNSFRNVDYDVKLKEINIVGGI